MTRSSWIFVAWFIGLCLPCFADESVVPAWQYRDIADSSPVSLALGLSEELPQDFESKVQYRGKRQRYTQLRYGSENSRRVVIVVDDLGGRQYDIYADLNRDRTLTSAELIPGSGRDRSFLLNTEIVREDRSEQAERRVELKLGITGKRFSLATVGHVEGSVVGIVGPKAQRLNVRRIDGNANGLFADSRDRLQVDLDGDGVWNQITEQFPYQPIVKINGCRFAVRSDRLGEALSLSEIEGVGSLRVTVNSLPDDAKLTAFEAMVFSNDASAYSLKSLDDPLKVPVGKYVLGSVTLTIDTGERDKWHFVFSRSGKIADDDWVSVVADSEVALEAVGEPRFHLGADVTSVVRRGRRCG